jgi:hypothetical protein
MKLTTRKLIVGAALGVGALILLSYFTYGAVTATLSGIDIGLGFAGTLIWSVSVVQALYIRSMDKKHEIALEAGVAAENSKEKRILPSTHGKVAASLNMTAASCFIVMDGLKLINPSISSFSATTAMGLWLSKSAIWYTLSHKQGLQEDKAKQVMVGCVNDLECSVIIESMNLIASILYTTSVYSDSTINPFKGAFAILWMLAALHDTAQSMYERRMENSIHPSVEPVDDSEDVSSSPAPTPRVSMGTV